jgi:hypothetical protein
MMRVEISIVKFGFLLLMFLTGCGGDGQEKSEKFLIAEGIHNALVESFLEVGNFDSFSVSLEDVRSFKKKALTVDMYLASNEKLVTRPRAELLELPLKDHVLFIVSNNGKYCFKVWPNFEEIDCYEIQQNAIRLD